MEFKELDYRDEQCTVAGRTISYRAWRGFQYVRNPPLPKFQVMNLFAPAAFFQDAPPAHPSAPLPYDAISAPIFVPNQVGGYMPGKAGEPGLDAFKPGQPNTVFEALSHGYVVACPAIRGRSQISGKAPACVVDYKAALRYLRHFGTQIPGNPDKIITNGTSAGGAISAVLGASGNHPAYETYLEQIGAWPGSDQVWLASCYCPITNLEHADSAYEWQFAGIYSYHRQQMRENAAGRPDFMHEDGELDPARIELSRRLSQDFILYLNSLNLQVGPEKEGAEDAGRLSSQASGRSGQNGSGICLRLEADGTGSFQDYLVKKLEELAGCRIDFKAHMRQITRMKNCPAFDDLTMDSPENNLFGTPECPHQHFTTFSYQDSQAPDPHLADQDTVALLNPMTFLDPASNYLGEPATLAPHWRIRHGSHDRDTSLAISTILALRATQLGAQVDHAFPWGLPHSGDYDLPELFRLIDGLAQGT